RSSSSASQSACPDAPAATHQTKTKLAIAIRDAVRLVHAAHLVSPTFRSTQEVNMPATDDAVLLVLRVQAALEKALDDPKPGARMGLRLAADLLGQELRDHTYMVKTAHARETEAKERQQRAQLHRLRALEPLADRLAGACFDYAEAAEDRTMVRAQL